jgi:uncharacterized protein (DUF2235 family)
MSEPIIAETPPKRRLAVFLDGTWNAVDDNTNVWRLKSLCSSKSGDGSEQRVYYEIGVNGLIGGLFGKGLDKVITDAYEWLIEHYHADDEIFIFGFSRGAFAARSLAGLIAKCGLLKPGAALGLKQLYDRYKRADEETIWFLQENHVRVTDTEQKWLLKYSQPIHIKVVAVWDTVGALGVPFGNIPGISRSTFGWLHTGLRVPIENAYHALAVDERRADFQPTLWTTHKDPKEEAKTPRKFDAVEQRWFVGAHANVGGGCVSDPIAQIPLRWMMNKASAHGLTFKVDVELDDGVLKAPISDSYREFVFGLYHLVRKPFSRVIGQPTWDSGTQSNINETIDASVFDRWRADPAYRPRNIQEWATRAGVRNPSTLHGSVMADGSPVSTSD